MRTNKFYYDKNPIPLLAGRLAIAKSRLREAEERDADWRATFAVQAFTAPDADWATIFDSFVARHNDCLAECARLRKELVALRPLVRRFGSQYENDDYDKALEGTGDEQEV